MKYYFTNLNFSKIAGDFPKPHLLGWKKRVLGRYNLSRLNGSTWLHMIIHDFIAHFNRLALKSHPVAHLLIAFRTPLVEEDCHDPFSAIFRGSSFNMHGRVWRHRCVDCKTLLKQWSFRKDHWKNTKYIKAIARPFFKPKITGFYQLLMFSIKKRHLVGW